MPEKIDFEGFEKKMMEENTIHKQALEIIDFIKNHEKVTSLCIVETIGFLEAVEVTKVNISLERLINLIIKTIIDLNREELIKVYENK